MIHLESFWVIAGMAGVTYLTRLLGYVALRHRTLSPKAKAVLDAAPGCVLISVIAPEFTTGNPVDLLALGVTALAASRLSMIGTVMVGMIAAAALRFIFH